MGPHFGSRFSQTHRGVICGGVTEEGGAGVCKIEKVEKVDYKPGKSARARGAPFTQEPRFSLRFSFSSLWAPVGACGRLWAPVGACGRLWAPVGTGGHLWAPVGACGHLWAPVGACERLWKTRFLGRGLVSPGPLCSLTSRTHPNLGQILMSGCVSRAPL